MYYCCRLTNELSVIAGQKAVYRWERHALSRLAIRELSVTSLPFIAPGWLFGLISVLDGGLFSLLEWLAVLRCLCAVPACFFRCDIAITIEVYRIELFPGRCLSLIHI